MKWNLLGSKLHHQVFSFLVYFSVVYAVVIILFIHYYLLNRIFSEFGQPEGRNWETVTSKIPGNFRIGGNH